MADPFLTDDFDTPSDPFAIDITARDPFGETVEQVTPKSAAPADPFAIAQEPADDTPLKASKAPKVELPATTDAQPEAQLEVIEPEKERDSMLKAAAKGLARGIDSTQGMLYGLAALAGDATGWDKLRDAGAEGYARNMQEAARNAGNVKFTDIEGVGDFAEWAAGGIGELVPTMATMIAGGGVGGLAAKAFLPSIGREAVKRLTLKKLKKEIGEAGVAKLVKDGGLREVLNKSIARAGATAGGFAANAGLNTGEVYSNFIDPQTGEIIDTAPRAGRVLGSIGGGLLAGALDTAVPLSILNRVSPVKSTAVKKIMDTISNSRTAKVAAAKLLLTTGAEGTTEALQELVGETVGVTVDQAREWDWEEFKPQAIEAFALGALGGAFMGGPVTVMDVMQGNKLAKQQDQSDSDFIEKQAGIYNSFKETGTGISSVADSYVASYEAAMSEADAKIAEGGLKPDSREAVDIRANALNDVVKEFNEARAIQEATDTSVEQDAPSATNPIAPTADPVSDKQSAQLNVQTAREVSGDLGSEVSAFNSEEFTGNAAAEIQRVRATPLAEEGGATFNADGTAYDGGGIVIGVSSSGASASAVTPESQAAFAASHADKLEHPLAKAGIFKFKGGDNASYDLSIVVPAEMEAEALQLAKDLGQESIWHIDRKENIKTGESGKNPKEVSTGEFFKIADRFVQDTGERPAIRFTQRPTAAASAESQDDMGRKYQAFFSDVTTGKSDKYKPDLSKYTPVMPMTEDVIDFQKLRYQYRGSFDDHIMTSIPSFDEIQAVVGKAVVDTFPKGTRMLDIGASEGALIKAISKDSDGRVTGIALDPNQDMRNTFHEKGDVEGVEHSLTAFVGKDGYGATMWSEPSLDGSGEITIKGFDPKGEKFDVIHEAMVFQFIDSPRSEQIDAVAGMLAPDGMAIFEEKFTQDPQAQAANEAKKDTWKAGFYDQSQLNAKEKDVLRRTISEGEKAATGMQNLQVSPAEFEATLKARFEHVAQFWDSGNFRGYVATNDKAVMEKFLGNLQGKPHEFETRPTPVVVDDGTRQTVRAPEASGQAASAVEIFNDKSVMSPPVTRGRVKIADLAAAFDERAKELGYNIQPNDYSPAALEHISEAMAHDMARQLSGDGSGVGWYDIKTRSAMELMARLHPEISTDPRAELTFKTFVSIFSQNNDVVTNFEAANRAYAYFKKNGKLPSWEFPGKSNNIIRANAEKLMSLIESEGHEVVSALLAESKSVAEWSADGYEVNGELKSAKVTGAMVLMGSKIGSFYGNLNGDFSTLTADLWFSRMWNRYTGNVAKKFDINDAEQTDEVLQELKSYRGKSLLHGFSKSQILADKKVLEQWARKAAKEYALGKYKNKHPLNVKANTLYKKMDGVTNDIPRNGSERQAMRGAVSMAIDKLVKDGYPRLEVADAQAILWYSEKDLYKLYKSVNKSSEKTDYEIAAQKVLDSKGIDSTVDDQFVRSEPGADGARTGTSQPKYGQRDPSVEAGATAELKTTREASPLRRTSQTKAQATTLIKNVTKAAQRMGLRVDVRAPDTTNPDPFFRNVGGKYNPSQKTINLVISSEMTHTDQVVVLHEVLHDLYGTAPVAIQEALLRWTTKMSNGELAPLTDRISTDPRIRPDNPYGLPELEFQEELLVESLAAEGVDSQIAEGIVADLIRILKDLWFRAAIKFQEMFNGQVSEEIAIAWAQNKTQAIIAGQSPYLDLWSMVRGGRMSTTVDDNSAMHQGLSSFAYRMSNGKMVLNDLVPVDAEAAIANMDSIIDQGNIEMIMDDTDNRRVGEEGLRYTTERSVERMAQLDADYFAALQVGNTELADRLVAEAADLQGLPDIIQIRAWFSDLNPFEDEGLYSSDIKSAYIVGSRARGTSKEGSDYDIALEFSKEDIENTEMSPLKLSEVMHARVGFDMPQFNDLDVDFQIFMEGGYEQESYSKINLDTITRDDNGNVIPLSQRFQVESDNIRFTQRPVAATLAAQKEQTMRRLESSVRQDIASLNELDAALAPTLNKLSPAVTREEFFGAIPGLSDPRLEIQKVLIAYGSNKNLTMPDYQDSVSANDRLDTLTDAQNAVAREKTYRSIQAAQRQLGEAVSNNVIQSEKSAAKIEANEEAYNALIAKMGDLKETEREVRKGISQQISLLLEDLRANNRAQSKKGIAGQILQDLANKNEGLPFPKSTEKLLKGLINNDTPLLAIARDLMKLDVEWSGKGPEVYKAALAAIKEEIKVNLDSPLGELLSGKPFEVGAASLKALVESGDVDSLRGSAFLATMVAFVKNNRQAADALAASNQSAQVNLEIAEGLAAVKNAKVIEDANRILDIYRTKTPNGVRDRIVISFAKAKQEMNTAKKALAKSKKNAAMLSPAAGDMHKAYNKASKEIGKNGNWTFQDGAEVPIPASNEQNPREVLYGKHEEIDMTQFGENVQGRKDGMTYIGKMAKRITDYLGANQESKDTYEYQELSRIAESLGQQYLESAVVQADPGGLGFRLRDPGSQMRNSGTVAGTRVAGRLEEFAKLNLKYQGQVFDGYKFSRKYRNARKAASMGSNDAFYYMCNKALAFLEGERVLDGQAAFDAMFDALSIDPNMARALSQKNAKKEFQALLIEWARQSQAMDNVRANEGLLVRDEGGDVNPFTGVKRDLYRDSLNRGLFMVPRVLSRKAFSIMQSWMGTPGSEGIFTDDSPLNVNDYADNPDGVAARVSQILGSNGSFFNHVVNPFILNDRSNKYPHPQDEAVKLDLSVVAAAWSESGQDVVKTAEILADQYGVDPTEYVPKFFSAFKAQLVKFQKKNSEAQEAKGNANMGGVSTFAADSRVDDDFPSEMTEYITFSHQQNSVSIKQIAIEKAMGRNMEGLTADINATARDINEQADIYDSAVADNSQDMKAVKALLGKDFKTYQAASKAAKNGTYDATQWNDNMKSILGNRDNMSDIGMWETGFGMVITGLLSGWKTGAKQLSQVYSGFMGDGAISRWNFLDPFQKTMETGVMLASWPFRLFGMGFDLKSVHRTALLDAGVQDFEGAVPISDRFSDLGFNREFEKDGRSWTKKIARGIQSAASGTTFNRGERKQFSPSGSLMPFRALNMSSAMFDTNSVMKKMIKISGDVSAYLKENPNAVESDITAENLGYKDRLWGWDDATDFTNFKTQLNAAQGISLIAMANEADALKADGKYPLSKDTIASAYAFTKTNRSFESTLVSRPTFSQKNTAGRLSLSLLGWSLEVAMHTTDMLLGRDTTGRKKETKKLASSIAGLKAIMFGVLPYALLYSLFFDFWDEEISGKKSDIRPLTTKNGLDELAMSVLERVGHMGPIGMWGEVANSAVNMGTGKKVLSFDERVVWASTLMSAQNMLSTFIAVEGFKDPANLTYNTFWRPMLQTMGFGGTLSNTQVINNVFGFDNAESRTAGRTNVNNALRGAGRSVGVEVRVFGAGGSSRPTPTTPHVTNMILAALSDDGERFKKSYDEAVRVTMKFKDISQGEAQDKVKRSFASRHPIKSVFRSPPTTKEYQQMLAVMNPNMRFSVEDGLASFSKWGQTIGVKPYFGKRVKQTKQKKLADTPRRPTIGGNINDIINSNFEI